MYIDVIFSICLCFSYLDQDLQHFPHIKVKLKVQRRDRDGDGERSDILNIRLEKINSRRHSSRAFVPRYPKVLFFLLKKYFVMISSLCAVNIIYNFLDTDKRGTVVVGSCQYLYI